MIRSDLGTIELNGIEPVIMAEFTTLLVSLRDALGEGKYNLALQIANEKKMTYKAKEALRNGEKERMVEVIKAILSRMEDE